MNENENGLIIGDGLIISVSVVLFDFVSSWFGFVGVVIEDNAVGECILLVGGLDRVDGEGCERLVFHERVLDRHY